MPLFEARHLTKRYGTEVLRDASLTIERGELVCILGPSGSGKSTLLTLLGALERPSEGEVLFNGTTRLHQQSESWLAEFRRSHSAFIFQSHNLLPTLSAEENVMLPLLLGGRVARKEAKARARAALETVNLLHRAASRPTELSGGESQRVAIARALAQRTDLILADEPTASLDSKNGRHVIDLLCAAVSQQQKQQERAAVVIVTHDESIALRADRVFDVRDGRVAERPTTHHSGIQLCA